MDEMRENTTMTNENGNIVEQENKSRNPFKRNLIISGVVLGIVIVFMISWLLIRPDNRTSHNDLFDIQMISELTTLQCRYHNVAVHNNEGAALGIGRQYVWFEYDVIIDVGIDVNQVQIEGPSEDGVIKIYLPPAQILGAKEDEATISKPVCELGAFTSLTAEEERRIIAEGVTRLKQDAQTQDVILQAYNSAKNVLENYIINIGKLMGEEYTIEWVNASNILIDQTTTKVVVNTETSDKKE